MTTEIAPRRQHRRQGFAVPVIREPEIKEPGSGDFDGGDRGEAFDDRGELLCNLSRRLTKQRGESHRNTRRVIAMLGVAWPFESELGHVSPRQAGDRRGEGGVQVGDGIDHTRIVAKHWRRGAGAIGGTAARDGS